MVLKVIKIFESMVGKFQILPNGSKIPSLGLGTSGTKVTELEKALDVAFEVGYRHVDTAMIYQNEKTIGNVVQRWFKSGKLKRNELFITTKLPSTGLHPDRIEKFLKKSLSDLQLDYVDLYLIHFPVACVDSGEISANFVRDSDGVIVTEPKSDFHAIWKKMEEQVDRGYARNIGLSNFNVDQIEEILKIARIKPANLQIECHVYLQQNELVDFCHRNGITVTAFSPLGSPSYNDRMKKFSSMYIERPLANIMDDPVINQMAQKYSKTPAQIILRFLMQRNIIPIPKSVTPQRIRDNFNVFDFNLDGGDLAMIRKLEIGEKARISDFQAFTGVNQHPDFPFKK